MNIIKHLTEEVSSLVITDDADNKLTGLLEQFYSIVLARITEQKAYNKLTNDGKLPAKKTSLYKVFHNIDWAKKDSAEQVVTKLAESYDLTETAVKDLLKQVTPLMFIELGKLAEGVSVSEFVQGLLTEPSNRSNNQSTNQPVNDELFTQFIPRWALALLPIGQVSDYIFQTSQSSQSSLVNQTEAVNAEPVSTIAEAQNSLNTVDEADRLTTQTEASQKVLPSPVHADASQYSYENISNSESSSTAGGDAMAETTGSESHAGVKGLLPIVGLVIFTSLAWALLRGCQESTVANEQQAQMTTASSEANKATEGESSTGVTDASLNSQFANQINADASAVSLSVDKEGKLTEATVLAGSNALSFKVNSAIAKVFGESALEVANVSVDNERSDDMLSMDKFNGLLLLLQSIPNASMLISENDIRFDAPAEEARKKLVSNAQRILSSYSVTAGTLPVLAIDNNAESAIVSADNATADADTNVNVSGSKDSKQAQDTDASTALTTEQSLADGNNQDGTGTEQEQSVVAEASIASTQDALNKPTNDKNSTQDKESAQADEQEAKPESVNAQETEQETEPADGAGELDVNTAVADSIDKSKEILAGLSGANNEADLKAIETALNTQIINFAVNDNDIPTENKAILKQSAQALKGVNARLKIIGHTDSDGNEDYNKRLSQDRSFSVKKYLMSQGISSERMTADGMGESKPVASNATEAGKFKNRRIEFIVTKIESKPEPKSK